MIVDITILHHGAELTLMICLMLLVLVMHRSYDMKWMVLNSNGVVCVFMISMMIWSALTWQGVWCL